MQLPNVQALHDEAVQPLLEDRDLAVGQHRDLRLVDVEADDVVSEVGQACAGGQPDVSGADHGDS